MKPQEINDIDYAERISRTTGLLLSHKPACPHCKNMKVVVDKFQKKEGPVDYLTLDTEANAEAMAALGIERVPTLFIIKKGEIKIKKPGLMNPRELAVLYKNS